MKRNKAVKKGHQKAQERRIGKQQNQSSRPQATTKCWIYFLGGVSAKKRVRERQRSDGDEDKIVTSSTF